MRSCSLLFLLGCISFLFLNLLIAGKQSLVILVASFLLLILLRKNKFLLPIIIIAMGFLWCNLQAVMHLRTTLPNNCIGKTVLINGTIISVPEQKENNPSFIFQIKNISADGNLIPWKALVRLNWFKCDKKLAVGDNWQLTVRLKPPRGYWDEASFDYQKWLFEQNIRAVGYVVNDSENLLLQQKHLVINKFRQQLANVIESRLLGYPLMGLITALAVGVRDQVTEQQWETLRGTGTNHLFAIAGLHIGLVCSFIYILTLYFFSRIPFVPLYYPAPQLAIFCSLIVALIYSALAGFSLPTQRAIFMITIFLITTLIRKNLAAWTAWCLALLILLVINPLVVLSDSFWLSFGAVALIVYSISGRLRAKGMLNQWGKMQWAMTLGLVPLCLLFFQQAALAGFIANAIAIPWVGFIVLPLTLIGNCVWLVNPFLAGYLWLAAEKSLEIIWPFLTLIAKQEYLQWTLYLDNPLILICGTAACLLFLAPRGFYGRFLGVFLILPFFYVSPPQPKSSEIWFSLLDVGQGLASVIQTQHHVLVYDTGPKFNANFDTGSAVVVPYLNSQRINKVDVMMISHGDNDHIGGANSIIAKTTVGEIITSVPEKFPPGKAVLCYAGQQWQWDNVNFLVIYPPKGLDNLDNDSSCVLKIDNGKASVLLTGDIESKSEKFLLKNANHLLASTILIAPHHGSISSSGYDFVNAVRPQYVLFPTGFLNRYHFPNSVVLNRYQQINAKIFDTAQMGQINMRIFQNGLVSVSVYKKHFWDF